MKRVITMNPNQIENNIPMKVTLVEKTGTPSGVRLVNSYAATKSTTQDLVTLAAEIQKADDFIRANAANKLQVIAENMRFLQHQAEKVLLEAKEHSNLHHAACNFVKHPGNIYHLYERESGQYYFSMLSPEEWGINGVQPLHTFKGSYRLEHDQSWTPVSQIKSKDDELNVVYVRLKDKHLFKNQVLALNSSETMNVD